MRVLLDTQAWLWMLMAPERFSRQSLRIVETTANELVLSAASAWEIGIKHELGRLELPGAPETVIPDLMLRSGVEALAISHAHALRAGTLPPHHRDPFDRLLIAQAQLESLPILTSDNQIALYEVEVISAGYMERTTP
ncbi:MAG: type II toxin-antitoxin system VapC family toxin [Longimicrobiales bacterium]|nr:type II toxin-antitoxin system VapC family toxin [Longimicrobiales bacterium]